MVGSSLGDGRRLLSDISFEGCSSRGINTSLARLLIAACLVESRGDAYGIYLERVFSDDPQFVATIKEWAIEENEHGIVLATWLRAAFPDLEMSELLDRYNREVNLVYKNSSTTESIRGSKAAELLSRCAVESGTSTYYKAIAENVDDKALKLICMRLAKDEIKHYSVFKKKLDELRVAEKFGALKLLRMSLSRLIELEDDQVSYAYYIGMNTRSGYDKKLCSKLMVRTAYSLYSKPRISELVKLNLRAFGLSKSSMIKFFGYDRVASIFTLGLYAFIRARLAKLNLELYIYRGLGRWWGNGRYSDLALRE